MQQKASMEGHEIEEHAESSPDDRDDDHHHARCRHAKAGGRKRKQPGLLRWEMLTPTPAAATR